MVGCQHSTLQCVDLVARLPVSRTQLISRKVRVLARRVNGVGFAAPRAALGEECERCGVALNLSRVS